MSKTMQTLETRAFNIVSQMDIREIGIPAIPAIVELRKQVKGIGLLEAKRLINWTISERNA